MLDNNLVGCFHNQSRGSYVLLIELSEGQNITVGSLLGICFSSGFYAYVGSAMSELKSRLGYHLKRSKKRYWHIDYLLEKATIIDISICGTRDRLECVIARALSSQFDSIPNFGSSDCQCPSHLFYATREGQMKLTIMAELSQLVMRPRLVKTDSIQEVME